jgi:hypothetical protein
MAAATAVTTRQGNDQFRGLFSDTWSVSCTLDVGSLIDGAGETETIAVPGVALGDAVLGFSFGIDKAGVVCHAYVSAADVVTLRVQNESGSTVDLASTTVKVVVGRIV